MDPNERQTISQAVKIQLIALPVEHGGWGLLLEPVLIAMILAPSWAGFLLSVTALSVFLINRPLKVCWQSLHFHEASHKGSFARLQVRWAAFL